MKKNLLILYIFIIVVFGISMWLLQSDEDEIMSSHEIHHLDQFENAVIQPSYEDFYTKLAAESDFDEYHFFPDSRAEAAGRGPRARRSAPRSPRAGRTPR